MSTTIRMYNAVVDVAEHDELTDDQIDTVMTKLEQYHAVLGGSPRGWQSATISLPAETLAQATATALSVVESAYGVPAIACEVMTTDEFDARQGWAPVPELVSVSGAAELLGVSRQRILQRIDAKTLPATRVGRDWVIARSAVVAGDQGEPATESTVPAES